MSRPIKCRFVHNYIVPMIKQYSYSNASRSGFETLSSQVIDLALDIFQSPAAKCRLL
jgi:hypothetical protein